MTNALAINQERNLMPALSLDEAAHRYNLVVEYTKKMMTAGKDYGVIPGTGDKPTLLKPGAEKLCSLFGLYPDFETIDKIADFDKGLFFYRVKCTLYRNGDPVASGVGSCNSKEKKYRYRYVYDNKATEEEKAKAVSVETKDGKFGKYKVYKVENSEPFELVNTIDKMAQKRALVAATLIGANASEFFTQDVEDMGFIDGDFSDVVEPKPQPKPKKVQTQKPTPTPRPAHNTDWIDEAVVEAGPEAIDEPKEYDFKTRPYDADTLKAALAIKTDKLSSYKASDKQRGLLRMLLNEHFQDDAKRHEACEWLLGAGSTKEIPDAMVKVALDWLKPEKDDGGAYQIDATAKKELSGVLTVALEAAGQEALL